MTTRILVGVSIVQIVALLAELNLSSTITELLNQKTVVLLHNFPYQGSWYYGHFLLLQFFNKIQINLRDFNKPFIIVESKEVKRDL